MAADTEGPGRRRRRLPAAPGRKEELGFVRRPMVRWLDPHQLLDTSHESWRPACSRPTPTAGSCRRWCRRVYDRSDRDELWVDYVSDLGDGWNSTYTVASLLAQAARADRPGPTGDEPIPIATERGSILVMGGDQVYPVPTRTQYENRLIGPYRAALPCAPGRAPRPLRHPRQPRLVRRAHQLHQRLLPPAGDRRVEDQPDPELLRPASLPHRWWLWGVDLQFGDYLDEAQLAYFAGAADRG